MNIMMAGIDYSMAGIEIREKFSFSKERQKVLYQKIMGTAGIHGAVLISTCNRTELYLSVGKDCYQDPFELLCAAAGIEVQQYVGLYRVRRGREAFAHLCRLACGLQSQILGEDQIITQVKESLVMARQARAADGQLEVMFRTAVTAAKKIKTTVRFSRADQSVAHWTLRILNTHPAKPKRILVIGNGQVGRLVAATLIQHGFQVCMTLRQYRHGRIEEIAGVTSMDYAQRYEHLPDFDAVVSATLSQHCTMERARLMGMARVPRVMIDLALPRDIEPAVGELEGVTLYNIDTIGSDKVRQDNTLQLEKVERIIEHYRAAFQRWIEYKELISIESIYNHGL